MRDDEKARAGYQAYAQFTGGKTFDGRRMPTWEELPDRIRDAWWHAAEAIVQKAVERAATFTVERGDVG